MISPKVLIKGTDHEAFALTINQAVGYTGTRVPPRVPDFHQNFQVFQTAFGHAFKARQRQILPQPQLVQRSHNFGDTTLANGVLPSQQQALIQVQVQGREQGSPQLPPMSQRPLRQSAQPNHNGGRRAHSNPSPMKPSTVSQADTLGTPRFSPLHFYTYTPLLPPQSRPVNPLSASTIHPNLMQRLRLANRRFYNMSLSRELQNPRPKSPQCPPPISKEALMRYEVQRRTFYYRQGLAWQFLRELEENGWVGWERTMVDVKAVARDFAENSEGGGADVLVGEEIADEGEIGEFQQAQPGGVGQERSARTPIVQYAADDEEEEEESESEDEREELELESLSSNVELNNVTDIVDGDGDIAMRNGEAVNDVREVERQRSVGNGSDTIAIKDMAEQEKKVKAVKQARRENNRRIAYFLADMVIEANRIKEMGF
ncbi:hypothetical protein H2198_003975 [Neophaeococcomyces mojaviensis]|uniref:Uncharacterized protein n=1 Tax=Neophaeococcomyces mojaviensis TaxID=3383035 RepID=A0ACC3A9Z7_9EURO|nr:hypothetical protein H2198_003975 [Knufia sp. JES_112]